MNPIFSAIKLFFFSSQQRRNQFTKSSKSLKKEEQEESSSLGCYDSATANLVEMDSIVIDKGSSNKISKFIFSCVHATLYVTMSVRPSVRPKSLCFFRRIELTGDQI